MRRLASIALAVGIALSACTPETSTPPAAAPSIATLTPTATPTVAPAPTLTSTPTPIPLAEVEEPAVDPPFPKGYAFEFSRNYAGDATVTGRAHTCGDIKGPWHLEVAVSGSPEPGVTLETTGVIDFSIPADTYLVEVRIPTTGTGTFDYGDGVGEGTIDDPLLFMFELAPVNSSAAITITSTADGTVTLHLSDGDITTKFATVFMEDPEFILDLTVLSDCP